METNQIDQGKRLSLLIKALGLNQSTFARSLDMSQPNISRMVGGEHKLSSELIRRITIVHTRVNTHWLLTGLGSMFLSEHGMLTGAEEPGLAYKTGLLLGELEATLENHRARIETLENKMREMEERKEK